MTEHLAPQHLGCALSEDHRQLTTLREADDCIDATLLYDPRNNFVCSVVDLIQKESGSQRAQESVRERERARGPWRRQADS